MADLKDLQKMAKEGKISEELLKDDKFKAELKRILKEECKVEITDEDIPEIVKNLEENLKETPDDEKIKQVLSEEAAENVSGGLSKARIIKGVSTLVGATLGAGLGYKVGGKKIRDIIINDYYLFDEEYMAANTTYSTEWTQCMSEHQGEPFSAQKLLDFDTSFKANHPEQAAILENARKKVKYAKTGAAVGGGIAGLGASYLISDYICKKFDIK